MSNTPSSIVMIPEKSIKELRRVTEREQEATLRLGALQTEYHRRQMELLDLVKKAVEDKSTIVREGLIALGLDPDEPGRHFYVHNDGGVTELVNGNQVTPQGIDIDELLKKRNK